MNISETLLFEANPVSFDETDSDHMTLETADRMLEFWYPKSNFVKNLIVGIIKGPAYPVVTLPGYRPDTILDIGANIGAAAVYFYLHYPVTQIHCYEPACQNLAYLSKNTEGIEHIHIHPYGLYNKTVTVQLYKGRDISAQNSVIKSGETSDSSETVRLESVSAQIETLGSNRLSIIKIDTEGCEVPILYDIVAYSDRIDWIYLEYHSETDRLEIDAILSEDFLLLFSNAPKIHRGTILYVAKHMIPKYPQLEGSAFPRPSF